MLRMLPRRCYTDWSGHSSLIVLTSVVGIPCGAVSWRLLRIITTVTLRRYVKSG